VEYHTLPEGEDSPDSVARFHHEQLLRAAALLRHGVQNFMPDLVVHFVHHRLLFISSDALEVARAKGELSDCLHRIRTLLDRAGISWERYLLHFGNLTPEERTPEYWREEDKRCRLETSIQATITVHLLRKYRLEEIATLYESDPMKYAVMKEVGRRITRPFPRSQTWKTFYEKRDRNQEDLLLGKYGSAAVELLRQRLRIWNGDSTEGGKRMN
jgi:hypothetical protein